MLKQVEFAPYQWWRKALSGRYEIGGPDLPVCDGYTRENKHIPAQEGFFRRRTRRGGPFVPVAIYCDEDVWLATVGVGRAARVADAGEEWLFCCRYPVTEGAYRAAAATGPWDDADKSISATEPPPERPAIDTHGHNEPDDDAEIVADQIASARDGLSDYAVISDDTHAARAQSLRARLQELARIADKKRDSQKRPFFEAGKAIDEQWRPIIQSAKSGATEIATALSAYETQKARAAAALAAAAARKPEQPPEPESTQIRGAYGRAAAVRVVRKLTHVEDWNALWEQFGHEHDVQDALVKFAQRAISRGHAVRGVTVEEQREVR
jgi:hypothetical protein